MKPAGWVIEIDEGRLSPTQRREFDEWLNISPEHRKALARIVAAWLGAEALRGTRVQSETPDDLAPAGEYTDKKESV